MFKGKGVLYICVSATACCMLAQRRAVQCCVSATTCCEKFCQCDGILCVSATVSCVLAERCCCANLRLHDGTLYKIVLARSVLGQHRVVESFVSSTARCEKLR